MSGNVDDLIADLRVSERLLVVTGAGISVASGIPTFRGPDPDAIWATDVTELGTNAFFQRDPAAQWRWYLRRFDGLGAVAPNAAHRAVAALERWQIRRDRGFLLVTQNIDGLHADAGSTALIEVHGTHHRLRCSAPGCVNGAPNGSLPRDPAQFDAFRADPSTDNVPKCPRCGAFLRAHVLWFDERYDGHVDYGIDRVVDAAWSYDTALFIGTSFAVGVTDLILGGMMQRRRSVTTVDPHRAPPVGRWIAANAEEILPEIVARL